MIVSPLKDPHNFKCASVIQRLVPTGNVINVPLFFSGDLSFSLTSDRRFVRAVTSRYVIYEFWKCAFHDPDRIINICDFIFGRLDPMMLYYLQENWPAYKDPYLRSSLFFILNRCSESGRPSLGEISYDSYNPHALHRLKTVDDTNLSIELIPSDFLEDLRQRPSDEYVLMPIGDYSYNLFEHGKSESWEITRVNHEEVRKFIKETNKNTILAYKMHPALPEFYKDFYQI